MAPSGIPAASGRIAATLSSRRSGVSTPQPTSKGICIADIATKKTEMVAMKAGLSIRIAFKNVMEMGRSEEHTSELQSLMRISYAVFCLKKKKNETTKKQRGRHNTGTHR